MTLRRRILLIIGGTLDAIIHRGILEERIAFLEKPFSPAVLAQRVREVIGWRRAKACSQWGELSHG